MRVFTNRNAITYVQMMNAEKKLAVIVTIVNGQNFQKKRPTVNFVLCDSESDCEKKYKATSKRY